MISILCVVCALFSIMDGHLHQQRSDSVFANSAPSASDPHVGLSGIHKGPLIPRGENSEVSEDAESGTVYCSFLKVLFPLIMPIVSIMKVKKGSQYI